MEKTKERIAIICDSPEQFADACKSLGKNITWEQCDLKTNPSYGTRVGISNEGWCGDKWFRDNRYELIEYSQWKNPSSVINNYEIY